MIKANETKNYRVMVASSDYTAATVLSYHKTEALAKAKADRVRGIDYTTAFIQTKYPNGEFAK